MSLMCLICCLCYYSTCLESCFRSALTLIFKMREYRSHFCFYVAASTHTRGKATQRKSYWLVCVSDMYEPTVVLAGEDDKIGLLEYKAQERKKERCDSLDRQTQTDRHLPACWAWDPGCLWIVGQNSQLAEVLIKSVTYRTTPRTVPDGLAFQYCSEPTDTRAY